MAKKLKIPDKYQVWINARKKYRLSHAQIQMARELGMNPKKFGKKANHKQEPWKRHCRCLSRTFISNVLQKDDRIKSTALSNL